jgi:hypothetical protein
MGAVSVLTVVVAVGVWAVDGVRGSSPVVESCVASSARLGIAGTAGVGSTAVGGSWLAAGSAEVAGRTVPTQTLGDVDALRRSWYPRAGNGCDDNSASSGASEVGGGIVAAAAGVVPEAHASSRAAPAAAAAASGEYVAEKDVESFRAVSALTTMPSMLPAAVPVD